MGRRRLTYLAVGSLALVTIMAGCGGSTAAGTGAADERAGTVALAYAQALFRGDYDQAQAMVEPSSRTLFQLVRLGVDPKLVTVRDLGVGATVVTGDRAVTTLVGTVCRGGSGPAASAAAPTEAAPTEAGEGCITNTDPASSNPIFKIALARQKNGTWMVSLNPVGTPPTGPAITLKPSATRHVP